jgi:outer membrane biosynthesis protein TonB
MTAVENTNRYKSAAITIGVHIMLLLACAYLFSVKPPNPPLPDYGVEVNFGIDTEGYGDIQGVGPATETATDVANAEAINSTEAPQDASPEQVNSTADADNLNTTTNSESPLAVKESNTASKPKETGSGNAEKNVKPSLEYSGNPANGGNNNGNKAGTVGDMGNPNGDLSSLNYEGNPGKSGKGASLQISGWKWDDAPKKADPFDETGKIVFQIKVDRDGNIADIKVIEKTVSPNVVQFYKNQVEELTFTKTRDNADAAEFSTGKITFVIQGK